ncbi:hypothetical protein D3C74_385620 [compost metagenome]
MLLNKFHQVISRVIAILPLIACRNRRVHIFEVNGGTYIGKENTFFRQHDLKRLVFEQLLYDKSAHRLIPQQDAVKGVKNPSSVVPVQAEREVLTSILIFQIDSSL